MIPSLRQSFNAAWTPARYARFLRLLEDRFGEPTQFRHSETPCFLPQKLVQEASAAGREIVHQLLANEAYLEAAHAALPAQCRAPQEDPRPLFVQADFGLDSQQHLKLVEIQGFPSLYGYQPALADAYREAYAISNNLAALPNNLNSSQYTDLLRRAIVAHHDPGNVVLLELDPWNQKTRHDFVATERLLGIRTVDAREIQKRGRELFHKNGALEIPIHRIYNRVIADELERRAITLPFDFRDDLNVEWAGHPNWFFLLSKFSLPFLDHPTVPRTVFLNDAKTIENPAAYVLKPLYSFAGSGVIIGPTAGQLAAIPPAQRANYVLQERVNFTPSISTPEGPAKLEIRVMYLWLDELEPVNLILRMGRGDQIGVDHNKGLNWVGASAAFIQENQP